MCMRDRLAEHHMTSKEHNYGIFACECPYSATLDRQTDTPQGPLGWEHCARVSLASGIPLGLPSEEKKNLNCVELLYLLLFFFFLKINL